MDQLYAKVDKTLSVDIVEEGIKDTQMFVSVKGIAETLDEILSRTIVSINPNNRLVQSVREYQKRQASPGFMTFKEAQVLRKQVNDATRNPDLLDNLTMAELQQIKSSVNSAFEDASYRLARDSANDPRLSEAFSVFQRTNNLYSKGMKTFDNVATQGIVKAAQKGFFNKQYIVNELIDKNRPELIDQLLKSIKGISKKDLDPDMQNLIRVIDENEAAEVFKQYDTLKTFGNMTLDQARKNYKVLNIFCL